MAFFGIPLDQGSNFRLCKVHRSPQFYPEELFAIKYEHFEPYRPVLHQKHSVEWYNEPSLLHERTIINLGRLTQWSLPYFYSQRSVSARASNLIKTLPIFTPNLDNPRGCSASRGPRTLGINQMLK